jgi:pimeloyl-ACP methyl ester carboxylesterase
MVPGKPPVLAKMLTPRRFLDHRYAAKIAPEIYGGTARNDPMMIKRVFDRQLMAGSRVGYAHQLMAGIGWTSVFVLPLIRQRTLIVAGRDDPIMPLANAKIMNRLLPNAQLDIHDGGHVELITNATEQARMIEEFRRQI